MADLSSTKMTCWDTKEKLVEFFTGRIEKDVIDIVIESRFNDLYLAYKDLIEITKASDLEKNQHFSSNDKENHPADTDSVIISNYIDWEKLSKNESPTNRILYLVSKGFKILVLMRGCPGSGKTYQATNILNLCYKNVKHDDFIFSADKYFINKRTGIYNFNRSKLSAAHQWAYNNAVKAVQHEVTPVIIDNTNIVCQEMERYVKLGVINGYWIEIVEPISEWAWDVQKLFEMNTHKVPLDNIQLMLNKYEHKNITMDLLLTKFDLKYYKKNKPPKLSNNFKKHQLCENIMDEKKVKENPIIENNNFSINDNFKDLCVSQKHNNNKNNQCTIFNSSEEPKVECLMLEKKNSSSQIDDFQNSSNDIPDLNEENLSISSTEDQASNYINKSVNTSEDDFLFMDILNLIPIEEYSSNVIFGINRDINEGNQCISNVCVGKLDKSTTTNDLIKNVYKLNLNELPKHYPENVCSLITELFDKCQGDLDWIVTVLAEMGHDISKQKLQDVIQFDINKEEKTIIDDTDYKNIKHEKKMVDSKERKLSITDNNLKKDIENKFIFGNSLYSEHILKIKKTKENQSLLDNDNAIMPLISQNVDDNLELEKNEGKFVQLVIDTSVLIQLCDYFGDNSSDLNKHTFPMSVKLPEELALQLYYYLVANTPHQEIADQEIILQDAILAKQLQEECNKNYPPNSHTNEFSFSAVLSKKLLLEQFKDIIDSKLVLNVFRAKGYKLQETCDYLNKVCGIKYARSEGGPCTEKKEEVKYESNTNNSPNYCEEAFDYANLRQQYLDKANQSMNKNYPAVTQHYLEKAEESRINEQYAKTKALEKTAKQTYDFTLDLHFLPVQVAIELMDMYLDNQILILKKCNSGGYTRSRQLTIITGRGKHSPNGIPRIKPVVVRRLQERQLVHLEPEKPGFIMVIIKKNSMLSSEL